MPASSRVLLVTVTGQDHPGVTHALTSVLSQHDARILDIGQAVIHDALNLGFLVEVAGSTSTAALKQALQTEAKLLDLQLRCTAITAPAYDAWLRGQSKRRFLVTLLGPSITAAHVAQASGIVTRHGLNIDRIERLSGRAPLDPAAGAGRMCVELAVSGAIVDDAEVRSELVAMTGEHPLDVAFQHDDVFRRHRRLVAFDMDSTLIQGEVIDELAALAGVGEQAKAITESAMRGELDFQQSFRKRVGLLKGLRADALDDVIARLPIMDGAERLITTLKQLGYKTAILSGGFTFFGRVLQERLGIDYLHANTLVVRDGVVTGEVEPPIVDGAAKAAHLTAIAAQEGLSLEQVIAVGDGANDLPMLRLAGLGIAFRAKPVVRANARQAMSTLGLDGILYLIGVRDRELGG